MARQICLMESVGGGQAWHPAQRYNAEGNPLGAQFIVNNNVSSSQYFPSLALVANGDFVISWTSNLQDGNLPGVFARRYSAAGVPLNSEFQVNTYTTGEQTGSNVAVDAGGNFVVVWVSEPSQDGEGRGVFAQRYSAAGVPVGGEFQVNTFTTGDQTGPQIAMDTSGDFLVAWSSPGEAGGGVGIFAQRYDSTGQPVGTEFQVNSFTTNLQRLQSLAIDAAGNFVVAWVSEGQDGDGEGVCARQYSSDGVPQGDEFRVNTYTTGQQTQPTVAMDADGDFVVAWKSDQPGGNSGDIYAQQFTAAGNPVGIEFRVNTFTTDGQDIAHLAMDADGDFVATWRGFDQVGQSYGIFAQRYSSGGPRVANTRINDGSSQRSRVSSLTLDFTSVVTLPTNPADAFQLRRQSDNALVGLSATVTNNTATHVTLTFAGGPVEFSSLVDGRYTLTAIAAQINGGNFDGNGDGIPGDDYVLVGSPANGLFRLFGDVDGNGTVNTTDFNAFRLAFGSSSTIFDFDNLAGVGTLDFNQFRVRFGASV